MMTNDEAYGSAIAIRRQLRTRLEGVNIKELLWKHVMWVEGTGNKPNDNVSWTMGKINEVDEMIDLIEVEGITVPVEY